MNSSIETIFAVGFMLGGTAAGIVWIMLRMEFMERHQEEGVSYFPKTYAEISRMFTEAALPKKKFFFYSLSFALLSWISLVLFHFLFLK